MSRGLVENWSVAMSGETSAAAIQVGDWSITARGGGVNELVAVSMVLSETSHCQGRLVGSDVRNNPGGTVQSTH
jgi:hypothetical protein